MPSPFDAGIGDTLGTEQARRDPHATVNPAKSDPRFSTLSNPASRESVHGKVHWKLETIEKATNKWKNYSVTGQFPLDGIKVKMDNTVPATGSYGQQEPLIQWIKGELEVISFEVLLFSRDSQEDIDRIMTQFNKLRVKDISLGRPPICRFTYGAAYNKECMVRGFGEVSFDRLREDGQSRKIQFTITLAAYKKYKVKEIDRNKPKHLSRHPMLSGADRMWEMVAAKEYGFDAAIYGDRIRKYNKSMGFAADEEVRVVIPKDDIILNEEIYPEFHAFDRADENAVENLINKIVARKNKTIVT